MNLTYILIEGAYGEIGVDEKGGRDGRVNWKRKGVNNEEEGEEGSEKDAEPEYAE